MIRRTAVAASSSLISGSPRQVCIVGADTIVQAGSPQKKSVGENGNNNHSTTPTTTTTNLIRNVVQTALADAHLHSSDIDGFIAVPSLTDNHFMEAHYQATQLGLFSSTRRPPRCRTIDTGGAGPITALLEAVRMIRSEALDVVAIVAADCVGSMDTTEFLSKANSIFFKLLPSEQNDAGNSNSRLLKKWIQSPAIPYGYSAVTEYQINHYGLTRDQLRMAVCLQSFHAGQHPLSLFFQKSRSNQHSFGTNNIKFSYTPLEEVQNSRDVTPHISLLECARRADGAACVIVASSRFLRRRNLYRSGMPIVIGTGEASGPLHPLAATLSNDETSSTNDQTPWLDETSLRSCENAMDIAYQDAGHLSSNDIDFFGLYDCFPVCLVRALEASGLCSKGQGGAYLEHQYHQMMHVINQIQSGGADDSAIKALFRDPSFFPVNTHGGLLCYGAPWEVPAMYNIVEAVHQLNGEALGRQIPNCRRAIVYGNGGIFSASAVAILAKST